jgi:hypothetical protein
VGALLDLGFHGPLFLAPPAFERVRTPIAGHLVSGLRLSVAVAAGFRHMRQWAATRRPVRQWAAWVATERAHR